jgi:hypothetical protein
VLICQGLTKLKDRLPTVNTLITLHFPQPNDKPAEVLCLTLAEAQELYSQLGQIIVPDCEFVSMEELA